MNNSYQVLGLEKGASIEEVKSAYRKLVKIYHPDRNPNNPKAVDQFRKITEAYDLIESGKADLSSEARPDFGINKPARIDIVVTATMASCFTGTFSEFSGYRFQIPKGFSEQEMWHIQVSPFVIFDVSIHYVKLDNFTLVRRDLYTTMEVSRKEVRKGRKFPVPNHPNPLGQNIEFPKDIENGQTAVLKGAGLPNHNGPDGDLRVVVTFKERAKAVRLATKVIEISVNILIFVLALKFMIWITVG